MNIELPPKYYLEHFHELLRNLEQQCRAFFNPEHAHFLAQYHALSEDAKCVFIRILNRKGHFFFKSSLSYSEIEHTPRALAELLEKDFIRLPTEEDLDSLLDFLPKDKLTPLLSQTDLEFKKSWSRPKLVELAKSQREKLLSPALSLQEEIVVQGKISEITYLLFLYFGKIQHNLTLYTLRDLGIRKSNNYKGQFKTKFSTLEEAQTSYFYADLKLNLAQASLDEIKNWPHPLDMESKKIRESLIVALGEHQKSQGDLTGALIIFELCDSHPGREKRIRLLHQLGQLERCETELKLILDDPQLDEEFLFAEDFLARKFHKKKTSFLTDTLRNAKKVSIDETFYKHPEIGIIQHFAQLGVEGFFSENFLWNSLFAVMFWEELFESEKSAIHNEFDRLPHDLKIGSFYSVHQKEIEAKLALLSHADELSQHLNHVFDSYTGSPNGIFSWHPTTRDLIEIFLKFAHPEGVALILRYMSQDFMNRSTGFPDLFCIEDQKIHFYEIKAEGDSLKQHQLKQLVALKNAGFEVEVLHAEYRVDPDQTYVVVDIETTGMNSPSNRITELGAVKIQAGKIIGTYQTLINPERSIPLFIQQLTGISNEMVRSAPRFEEVADDFDKFTQDAIFVAHNVHFDYNFIKAEFQNLNKEYKRAYFCTKVGMRKHYPGLDSYGLKNLSQHFEVPLTNHHRALSDAEAAAHLLLLINDKRLKGQSAGTLLS